VTKIFTVINRKGGQGKTTIATTLAAKIAKQLEPEGKRILIIDLDPQGHAAKALGVDGGDRCIGDLLLGQKPLRDVMVSADRSDSGGPSRPNLYVIPATDRLSQSRSQVKLSIALESMSQGRRYKGPLMEDILVHRLQPALNHFEYVFVDCPPSLGDLDEATYKFTQFVIVPVRMAYLDAAGAAMNLRDVIEAQKLGFKIKIAAVVPTFFRERELVAKNQHRDFARHYPTSVLARPIPQSVAIEKAQALGQRTIFEYDPDSAPALAMQQLVDQVTRIN
jgi:chromosome partitioning protein